MPQNATTPAYATSTATPWMADHSQGLDWPATWLNIRLACSSEPRPWLITVSPMLNPSGTQSW
jgi:hypothetical protein